MYEAAASCKDISRAPVTNWEHLQDTVSWDTGCHSLVVLRCYDKSVERPLKVWWVCLVAAWFGGDFTVGLKQGQLMLAWPCGRKGVVGGGLGEWNTLGTGLDLSLGCSKSLQFIPRCCLLVANKTVSNVNFNKFFLATLATVDMKIETSRLW